VIGGAGGGAALLLILTAASLAVWAGRRRRARDALAPARRAAHCPRAQARVLGARLLFLRLGFSRLRLRYTLPAVGCDSYWDNTLGAGYNCANALLKPGALLAVPPAALPPLLALHPVASRVAQALADYGGYIVDDTGSRAGGAALCMEAGVSAGLQRAYGVSVRIEEPLRPAPGQGAALVGT
jgi:hypothetical protein